MKNSVGDRSRPRKIKGYIILRKLETPGNFGCPKRLEKKMNFSPKRPTNLKISDMKP